MAVDVELDQLSAIANHRCEFDRPRAAVRQDHCPDIRPSNRSPNTKFCFISSMNTANARVLFPGLSAGDCGIDVIGDPGTKFDLVRYRRNKNGPVSASAPTGPHQSRPRPTQCRTPDPFSLSAVGRSLVSDRPAASADASPPCSPTPRRRSTPRCRAARRPRP